MRTPFIRVPRWYRPIRSDTYPFDYGGLEFVRTPMFAGRMGPYFPRILSKNRRKICSSRMSDDEQKTVSIALQQGQRRRIMKGMTYDIEEKHGYIYLVRTREFKSLNRPIYKVGRTSQCPDTRINRLHKYTKGSEIYLVIQCHVDDVGLIEKEILEIFCHQWSPGPDGSEDFIIPTPRDLLHAKQTIIRVIQQYEERRL